MTNKRRNVPDNAPAGERPPRKAAVGRKAPAGKKVQTGERTLKLVHARIYLFTIWAASFLFYIALTLGTSLKKGVEFSEASDATWSVAYVLLPILSAFGSFWFLPSVGNAATSDDDERVDFQRVYAMFVITLIFHISLFTFFSFAVLFKNFNFPDTGDSYRDRVNLWMKFVVLLSSLAVLPVGYVLKGRGPKQLDAPNSGPGQPNSQ